MGLKGMILAIDTATQMVSIALHDGRMIKAETSWETRRNHTMELAPAVKDLFDRLSVKADDLAAIALPTGPGSYTGLRIGMSLAKGMALASNPPTPLIGIPTLDIVAHAQPFVTERLVAVAQAGRKRINAGFYEAVGGQWLQQGDLAITTWPELLPRLVRPALIAGEVDDEARALIEDAGDGLIVSPAWACLRRAGVLAGMAWVRLRAGDVDDPATLAPFYLA